MYGVPCNRLYNIQKIRKLQIVFEDMLFLLQEGRLQRARRACSRMKKGMFWPHPQPLSEWRGE